MSIIAFSQLLLHDQPLPHHGRNVFNLQPTPVGASSSNRSQSNQQVVAIWEIDVRWVPTPTCVSEILAAGSTSHMPAFQGSHAGSFGKSTPERDDSYRLRSLKHRSMTRLGFGETLGMLDLRKKSLDLNLWSCPPTQCRMSGLGPRVI